MCKKEKKEILRILLPPIFTFLLNSVVYWGAPLIKTGIVVHNLSSSVDRIVPFMPQFIIIYFGCYIFWVVNYLLIAAQKEEHRYPFVRLLICHVTSATKIPLNKSTSTCCLSARVEINTRTAIISDKFWYHFGTFSHFLSPIQQTYEWISDLSENH